VFPRILLRIIQSTSAALPPAAQRACARGLATLQYHLSPTRRSAVLENLAQIAAAGHPDLADGMARRRAARSMFESHYRGWLEYLGSAGRTGAAGGAVRIVGAEHLERAIAGGRGAILSMPHLGNWEIAGPALTALGLRMHTVTGVQLHPLLARQIRALKEREGIRVSTPQDGFARLVSALRDGEVLALLVDGDVYSRSLPAEFFGRRVAFPAGPAILARRARVAILHAHAERGPDGDHRFSFDGLDEPDFSLPLEDDLRRLTQGMARAQERNIAAHVGQWCIFRPIWRSDAA
jgi:phosphatidylinositol dimannoside acyltransferase